MERVILLPVKISKASFLITILYLSAIFSHAVHVAVFGTVENQRIVGIRFCHIVGALRAGKSMEQKGENHVEMLVYFGAINKVIISRVNHFDIVFAAKTVISLQTGFSESASGTYNFP